jgi:TRAP-type C4-dicarboxylate transport system substrate-binding protein
VPVAASAQETIPLTIASSHPTTIPWVGMMQTHFQARTDEILAETGNYQIEWQEAYGGQLYRANATLNSVEDGITDVGWVFSMLEGGQLPLSQVSSYTPFSTNNPPAQLSVMWDLIQNNPDFAEEWSQYNLVVLGLTGTDNYDIYTAEPITSIADLDGMKISAPGALANWLRGTGANAVDGSLTSYYTDIQTGVSEGVLSLALGVLPTRVYEVAPYITRVQMGTAFSGAIAINQDSWDALPEEVQAAMREAGEYYTEAHAQDLLDRHEFAMNRIMEVGAEQGTRRSPCSTCRRKSAWLGSTTCPISRATGRPPTGPPPRPSSPPTWTVCARPGNSPCATGTPASRTDAADMAETRKTRPTRPGTARRSSRIARAGTGSSTGSARRARR